MAQQNEAIPFVVIEELLADNSLLPEDVELNFEFFHFLSQENNPKLPEQGRQFQAENERNRNFSENLDSSTVLIKNMLENDGVHPQEIEEMLKNIDGNAANKRERNSDWEDYDPEDFERENNQDFPKDWEDNEHWKNQYAPDNDIPDEIKMILDNKEDEYMKKLKEEQDNIKFIDALVAEELEENEKKAREEETESRKFIDKMLLEEEKKEEEKQPTVNCPICLDNLFSQVVFPLYNCKHLFHIECLESYVIEEIKKRAFPIKCPDPECKKEIPEDDIKDTLQGHIQYQDIYDEYNIKSYVESNPDQFLHCPTPDCKFVFCLDEGPRFNCPECQKSHCMACKVEWHDNMTCEQYALQKKSESDEFFMKFADNMKYKRCPKCKVYVERSQGCNAMTCSRCRTMFCYECGKQGDGHVCNHKIDPPANPQSDNQPFSLRKFLFG